MKLKKLTALLLAAVMAAGTLAGCGNSGNNNSSNTNSEADTNGGEADAGNEDAGEGDADTDGEPSGEEGEEEEQADVAPGKKGSIEFWTVFTGADGKSMQNIVDAYNATNPDYTVNHRAIEANDLYLKMPLAVQSQQDVPDVTISHIERIPLFVENGFLTDYNEVLDGSSISADNYNAKAWSMSELDGGHYGVPLDVHTYVLYVNMDLYEKYGNGALDDGLLTWDEIEAAGEACLADDVTTIGLSWHRVKFLALYGQMGQTLSTDGTTPDFNNDAAVSILEMWKDLTDKGYAQKEGDSTWEMFVGGNMMYCPEGIWMYNDVIDSGLNVEMFDYPVLDTDTIGNWTSSHQFVLPVNEARDEEKTEAVLDFVNYVGENGLEWALAGQVPAHNAIKEDPAFQELPQAFLADESDELVIYNYKYYGYAVEALDKIFGDVIFGRMDAQSALDQAVQETKDRIEMGD